MDSGIVCAVIGAGIALYGVVRYVIGIFKDGTRPRMASWIAWGTGNMVFTIAAFTEHSYVGAAIDAIATLANLVVIAASIYKKVEGRPNDIVDWSCLVSSVVCIGAVIAAPNDMLLGAIFGMLANAAATIPTVRHAWTNPREETWQLFAANGTAGALSLISIIAMDGFMLETTAGPLMTIVGSSSLVMIVLGRKWLTNAETFVVGELRAGEQLLDSALEAEVEL